MSNPSEIKHYLEQMEPDSRYFLAQEDTQIWGLDSTGGLVCFHGDFQGWTPPMIQTHLIDRLNGDPGLMKLGPDEFQAQVIITRIFARYYAYTKNAVTTDSRMTEFMYLDAMWQLIANDIRISDAVKERVLEEIRKERRKVADLVAENLTALSVLTRFSI